MIQLQRGQQVTAEYLTSIFAKMYAKVNGVRKMSGASTGQYLLVGTAPGQVKSWYMEPMSTTSAQYYDRPRIDYVVDDSGLRQEGSSFDYIARYAKDLSDIQQL